MLLRRTAMTALLAATAGVARAEVSPETVLATFDGGDVTAQDLRDRWWLTDTPDPIVLEALLTSAASSPTSDVLGALDQEILQAGRDAMCLAVAHDEGWDTSGAVRFRADSLMTSRHFPLWEERLQAEVATPEDEALAPYLEQVRESSPPTPEQRSGHLLFVAGQPGDEASLQAMMESFLESLRAGATVEDLARESGTARAEGTPMTFGPMAREQAPWAEAGRVIFEAEADARPRMVRGEMGLYVVQVDHVTPSAGLTPEEMRPLALGIWRTEQARDRQSELLAAWAAEEPCEFNAAAQASGDPLITFAGMSLTVGDLEASSPAVNWQSSQEVIDSVLPTLLLPRHLANFFPPDQIASREEIALRMAARSLWEERQTMGVEASPDLMRSLHTAYVRDGVLTQSEQHSATVVRVMPAPHGEEPTHESLARWPGLDAEATRVREALAGLETSPEIRARARELDAASDYTIESRDLGWLMEPPALLPGQAFLGLGTGERSEVVTARDDVRLIYIKTGHRPARATTFEEAEGFLREQALTRQQSATLEVLYEQLERDLGWHAVPPAEWGG